MQIKMERLLLHFLSHPNSPKVNEAKLMDQFSLLSRKINDEGKIYSVLQRVSSSVLNGITSKLFMRASSQTPMFILFKL